MPRRYSNEFKENALQYVFDHPDIDMHVCAEYLDMPYDTLYGWYKKARRAQNPIPEPTVFDKMTDQEKEIMRLKRELRDTKDALEVLKKAISILGE